MRLCEMGFPSDQVHNALVANGGNEEAALNALLSGPVAPSPAAGAPGAGVPPPGGAGGTPGTGAPPDKAPKPSGLFGRMWGSNK
jgi:hypothetical protein